MTNIQLQIQSCLTTIKKLETQLNNISQLFNDTIENDSVEIQKSSCGKYIFESVNGKLTCSCPAFKYHPLPKKPCKHLQLFNDTIKTETSKKHNSSIFNSKLKEYSILTNLCNYTYSDLLKKCNNKIEFNRPEYNTFFRNLIKSGNKLTKTETQKVEEFVNDIWETISNSNKINIKYLLRTLLCLIKNPRQQIDNMIKLYFNGLNICNTNFITYEHIKHIILPTYKILKIINKLEDDVYTLSHKVAKNIVINYGDGLCDCPIANFKSWWLNE